MPNSNFMFIVSIYVVILFQIIILHKFSFSMYPRFESLFENIVRMQKN